MADVELASYIDAEKKSVEVTMKPDVAAALEAEQSESDRAEVRALVRDRLAGLLLPFDVRGFVETTWADYLTSIRRAKGVASTEWTAAVRTLDDLLWSIVAKERTGQKARLTRMIPALVLGLRKGCTPSTRPPTARARSSMRCTRCTSPRSSRDRKPTQRPRHPPRRRRPRRRRESRAAVRSSTRQTSTTS